MTLLHIVYNILMLQILNQRSKEYEKLARNYTQMGELMLWKISSIQLSLEYKKRLAKMLSNIVHGGMT